MAKSLARGAVTLALVSLVGCKSKPVPVSPPPVESTVATTTTSVADAASAPIDAGGSSQNAAENRAIDESAAAKPTWRDRKRITSPDGSVAFDYPANVFKTTSTKSGSVTLKSDVSEAGMSGKGDRVFYTLTMTKLTTPPLDAVKKHLPPGFADTIPTADGTVDAYTGMNGAKGYALVQGVEGMGSMMRIVTTHDGLSWEMDCNFCCGMIEHPKMTSDEQTNLCEDVLHAFEAEH